MGRKSTARSDLLEAGKLLFHKLGYRDVSISQLCEAASVRSGTFFYFFKSKEIFAQEVLEEIWLEFTEFLLNHLKNPNKSPLERIDNFFEACYQWTKLQPEIFDCVVGCPFGNFVLEVTLQEPVLHKRLARAFKDVAFVLEKVLREANELGEIVEPDPLEMAQTILAGIEGIWMQAKLFNDPELVKRLTKHLKRLIRINTE